VTEENELLEIQFLLASSRSLGGEFVLQKLVKQRLRCCLNGELVQNRATGLRQELSKRKLVEIRYMYWSSDLEV
jgi:hypothetical protein